MYLLCMCIYNYIMYVCVYIYIYIYIYTHTYTCKRRLLLHARLEGRALRAGAVVEGRRPGRDVLH